MAELIDVHSPLPGAFYHRPSSGAEPYVRVGDAVTEGQTLGLIEIMKQYSELEAPASGVLIQIHVGDGDPIDAGSVVMTIEKSS